MIDRPEGTFSEHHTADARALYERAQTHGERLGRPYLLPTSMLLALLAGTDLLDNALRTTAINRQTLIAEVEHELASDDAAVEEALYLRTIASYAIARADARGEVAAVPRDVLIALLRSDPPSVVRVFEKHGLSLKRVEELIGG